MRQYLQCENLETALTVSTALEYIDFVVTKCYIS